MRRLATLAFITALTVSGAALAQGSPQTPARLAAQAEAMKPLAWMDGVWRGPAWTITATGRHEVTQTERIGPFVGGTVKAMEGRGYNPDGSTGFNAFAILSYEPDSKAYTLHSYAQSYSGDFPMTVTPTGYVWSVPAGPGMSIRYTATIKNGAWREVGEMIAPGRPPTQMFEMNLKRVSDSSWPAAGAVPMR